MRNDIDTLSKRYDDEMKAVHGETRNIQQDLQSMHLDHQQLEQNQRGMTTFKLVVFPIFRF
jgi:hypothetical protein